MAETTELQTTALVVAWVFTVPTALLVLLRIIVRTKLKPNWGYDDVAICASLIVNIALAIMVSVAVATGTGKHLDEIPPQKRATAIRINLAENCVSLFSFTVPKLAIALLLVRILGLLRGATVTLIGLAVILNLYSIVQSIVLSLETDPEISMKTAIGLGSLSAFGDFFYGLYPIAIIARLQMETRRKVALCIMFALGVVSCVVACIKCSKLTALGERTGDVTYTSASLMYWTVIEANVVTISANVPCLGPFFRLVWNRAETYIGMSSSRRRRQHTYQQFSFKDQTPKRGGLWDTTSGPRNKEAHRDDVELLGESSKGLGPWAAGHLQTGNSGLEGNEIGRRVELSVTEDYYSDWSARDTAVSSPSEAHKGRPELNLPAGIVG